MARVLLLGRHMLVLQLKLGGGAVEDLGPGALVLPRQTNPHMPGVLGRISLSSWCSDRTKYRLHLTNTECTAGTEPD